MDGIEYENYCIQYLRRNGFHKVSTTKASHDQGIDIIAYKHKLKYGFQCKYYSQPVSNKAVQEAYTGGAFYGCDRFGVITNTNFTKSAIELAEDIDVELYDHISPDHTQHIFFLFRIQTLFPIILGIHDLYQYNQNTDPIFIYQSLALIVLGISGMVYHRHTNVFTIICTFIYFVLFFISHTIPFTIFQNIILIYLIIYTIGYLLMYHKNTKDYIHTKAIQDRTLLHEDMEDTLKDISKMLEDMLRDEFQKEIQCVSYAHIHKGEDTFTFKCKQSIIQDIPIVEYSINQSLKHHNMNEQYVFKPLNPKEFVLVIQKQWHI